MSTTIIIMIIAQYRCTYITNLSTSDEQREESATVGVVHVIPSSSSGKH